MSGTIPAHSLSARHSPYQPNPVTAMLNRLFRAFEPCHVTHDGRAYAVRPPVVREVVILLGSARGFVLGEATHTEAFEQAARAWLPVALADALLSPRRGFWTKRAASPLPRRTRKAILIVILQLIQDGTPPVRAGEEDGAGLNDVSALDLLESLDVVSCVADFAAVYGMAPGEVYRSVSWPALFLFAAEADRIVADREVFRRQVDAIPHIEDEFERQAVHDRLWERAGYRKLARPMSWAEEWERRAETIEYLRRLDIFPVATKGGQA